MITFLYGLMDRETKTYIRFVVASEKKVAKAYFARNMNVYRHELKEMYKVVRILDINEHGEINE